MKKILKKITDLTINDILKKDIILPSLYFKKFNKHAKKLEIDIEDESFKKELDEIMLNELENIENYMNSIESNIKTMEQVTKDSKKALLENDSNSIDLISEQITKLQQEVNILNERMYKDELTKTYNRKWIYSKYLDSNSQFKQNGISILIDIIDFDYLQKEYGELLANNYIIFTITFLEKHLDKLNINYKVAKYFENKFLVFLDTIKEEEIENFLLNFKKILSNTTLKSNSGLLIKGNLNYYFSSYNKKQNSQEVFEQLFSQIAHKEE